MRFMISAALLTVGVILLVLGFNASDSVGSSFSRFFRGTPTDRATILLLCGAGCSVLGLVGVFLGFRNRRPQA